MPIKLSYHLPSIGSVSTTFHQESSDCYKELLNNGEVERLKRLDHLGVVRRAMEGAHHSRWEHMLLLFRLIDTVRFGVPEAHLSAGLDLSTGVHLSSGQELMKLWTLLLNVGHLTWTVTAEKAFLMACAEEVSFRQFESTVLPVGLKRFARRVMREENIYEASQVIAASRIESFSIQDHLRILWRNSLRAYCVPSGESRKLNRLRELYRKLENIAHMTLDPSYTPALVSLKINELLSDPRSLANVLFYSEAQFARLSTAIQDHLYERIYLNSDVSNERSAVETKLSEKIKMVANAQGWAHAVASLANGDFQSQVVSDATNFRTALMMSIGLPESVERSCPSICAAAH